MTNMLGYAIAKEQGLDIQKNILKAIGAIHIFEDDPVVNRDDEDEIFNRPGLKELVNVAEPNDFLVIVRLINFDCGLYKLCRIVDYLTAKNIGIIALEEKIKVFPSDCGGRTCAFRAEIRRLTYERYYPHLLSGSI